MLSASLPVDSRRSYLDKLIIKVEQNAKGRFNTHTLKHNGTLKQLAIFSHEGDTRNVVMRQLRAWLCEKRSSLNRVRLGLEFAEILLQCGCEELFVEMREDKAIRGHAQELHGAFKQRLHDQPAFSAVAVREKVDGIYADAAMLPHPADYEQDCDESCSTASVLSCNDGVSTAEDACSTVDEAMSMSHRSSASDVCASNSLGNGMGERTMLALPTSGQSGARSLRAQLWETSVQHTKLQRDYDELLPKAENEERLKIQISRYEEELQQLRAAVNLRHQNEPHSAENLRDESTVLQTCSDSVRSGESMSQDVLDNARMQVTSELSVAAHRDTCEAQGIVRAIQSSQDAVAESAESANSNQATNNGVTFQSATSGSADTNHARESLMITHREVSDSPQPSSTSAPEKNPSSIESSDCANSVRRVPENLNSCNIEKTISEPASAKGKGKGKGKQLDFIATAENSEPETMVCTDDGVAQPHATNVNKKGAGKGPTAPPRKVEAGPEGISKGKGKGKTRVEPSKRERRPSVPMKSIQFDRQLLGEQIKSDTIWGEVSNGYEDVADCLPVALIEDRFGKKIQRTDVKIDMTSRKQNCAGDSKMQLKSLSGEARLPYEITFKALKENLSAEEAVMALEVLDEHVLYAEDARLCNLSFLCPSAAQAAELAALKEGCEKDELHGVEQYMDKLGQVPYCGVRIGGLKLLRELPEDLALLTDQLTKFEDMITSFENSPCISDLLRFTLATVNLLNGDNARLKRADGFPITLLGLPGGLDAVKDANDRNVKYTIFELLFTKNRDLAESLMDALAPCFRLVSRSESRDADGNTRLNKRVVVQIENIEKELKKHTEALDEQIKELSLCLPHLPSDEALATSMPAKFQKLKQDINAMTQRKDRVNARFQKLKILFSAETHKVEVPVAGTVQSTVEKVPLSSEVWCQIWDNFFLCESPFLRADQRVREGLSKRLCKPDARVTVENLEAWWGVKKAKRGSSSTRTKSAS